MEVGDIYFPFVCLLHHILCLILIFANHIMASLQVIWSFPTESVCELIGRGGLLEAWMHGIAVFVPLWINLNCLGGVIDIPESRERGNWGG